jgi:hypothetical protein
MPDEPVRAFLDQLARLPGPRIRRHRLAERPRRPDEADRAEHGERDPDEAELARPERRQEDEHDDEHHQGGLGDDPAPTPVRR